MCDNRDMEYTPLHFFDQPIEVHFDQELKLEKNPDVPPNSFIWEGRIYRVLELLASWNDYKRRGRMARNMQPQHAAVASTRGSLNVGRFYFRVRVAVHPAVQLPDEQKTEQVFDIYYDRMMKSVDDRKGQWFIYREMQSAT